MLFERHSRVSALFFLTICVVSCVSPSDRSLSLTKEVFQQLPVPEDSVLLSVLEFEHLSKTGIGTHFGVKGLYGSDAPFADVLEEHRDLLIAKGWQQFYSFETQLGFCNPDYPEVDIRIADIAGFEENYADMLEEVEGGTVKEYSTLYIVAVSHSPFDSSGYCGN